jgi:hypothetical protein
MAVVLSQLSPALPLFAQRGAVFHWSAREENILVSPRNPLSAGSSIHGKTRGRGTENDVSIDNGLFNPNYFYKGLLLLRSILFLLIVIIS